MFWPVLGMGIHTVYSSTSRDHQSTLILMRSPLLPLEMRPDTQGDPGMQPRRGDQRPAGAAFSMPLAAAGRTKGERRPELCLRAVPEISERQHTPR